jgi:TPR repeat protein
MANLALLLATLLHPPELAEAGIWWQRAAEAGNVEAMFNLGVLFKDGDPGKAIMWWTRAAAAGHSEAKANLRMFGQRG